MFDFKIYENNTLVAEAESLTLSVSETHRTFKLENINIFPNFHLLNDKTNLYNISFETTSKSDAINEYTITDCTFKNRSPVSEDLTHIDFIEGAFDKILGKLDFLKLE